MKSRAILSGLVAVVLGWLAPVTAAQPEMWTTPQGTRVLFVQARELPIIDLRIDFAAGSAYDLPGKSGLAAMTAGLLENGAGKWDETAFADRQADLGVQLGSHASEDRAGASLRSLSEPATFGAAVDLLRAMLANPRFDAAIISRERARALADLQESLTRPQVLASRAFTQALYGDHPYGRLADARSLAAIGRDDMVAFHHQHYVQARASLAIVGDLDRPAAEALAEKLLSALPVGEAAPALPPVVAPKGGRHDIAHGSQQAHLLIGQAVLRRDDPDYYPLLVGNHVLGGGGFTSRLMKRVRDERGLAYSVYSYFQPMALSGPFQIGLQTRRDQAALAEALVWEVFLDFLKDGPTGEELAAAQNNIASGFPLRIDNSRKQLEHLAMMAFYRLPADWLVRYPQAVRGVTVEAVRDAFQRRVKPQGLQSIVVGAEK